MPLIKVSTLCQLLRLTASLSLQENLENKKYQSKSEKFAMKANTAGYRFGAPIRIG